MLQNYTVTVRRGKIPIGMYWHAVKYHWLGKESMKRAVAVAS